MAIMLGCDMSIKLGYNMAFMLGYNLAIKLGYIMAIMMGCFSVHAVLRGGTCLSHAPAPVQNARTQLVSLAACLEDMQLHEVSLAHATLNASESTRNPHQGTVLCCNPVPYNAPAGPRDDPKCGPAQLAPLLVFDGLLHLGVVDQVPAGGKE